MHFPQIAGGSEGAIVCNAANSTSSAASSPQRHLIDNVAKDLFVTFHCYCRRKDVCM